MEDNNIAMNKGMKKWVQDEGKHDNVLLKSYT